VRNDATALGAVEAMQAAEILFATALGVAFLHESLPTGTAAFGALLIVAGIVGLSLVVAAKAAGDRRETQALRSDRS